MPSSNNPSLTKRLLRAFIVAVVTAVLLCFLGILGLFMMIEPVGYFFSMTINLLGISDGGSFFYVILFWSFVAFLITLVLQSEEQRDAN
jgi:hypothetical protein